MRLVALAAAALLACGVKAPPRPPLREAPDAGAPSSTPPTTPSPGAAPAPGSPPAPGATPTP